MNGPEFLLFSKRNCIVIDFVSDFYQVIFEQALSLPQWVICLHATFGILNWGNHISSISIAALLP